ncbi:hypothetical protein B0T20DRAFT_462122 [Sordaria brevicollis]|uniref:Uncharacterized protein n=1 Tax=Sordaria brevicollis TaxID=83679 RepID=A0AAE0UAH2_SORBR|nr:hypothetical protein B0T20DRAFT_462122 [Sordaria brevicollis]
MVDSATHTSPPPPSSSRSSPSFHSLFGTSPPSHPNHDDNDHNDAIDGGHDEPSPTQPFSSPGEVSGFNGDGSLRDELTDSLANRDDDNLSAVLDSSDDERHCKINLSDRECVVAWKDAEHVIRHATKLKVDLHVDTGEQRALFVIHAAIYLKGSSHDYQIRLFVYPENIRSIEFERNADPPTAHLEAPPNMHMRLRFLMTQPPSLMIPKDRPLSPKERSRDLLETLKTLAAVQELDLYLNKFPFVPEHREQLSLLPGIFSSTKRCARPKTDFLRSNPQDMYKGRGAVIYETGATAVGPNATWADSASKDVDTTEQVAPAYTKDGSLRSPAQVIITPPDRKRRRTSESRSPSDVGKRILTTLSDLQNRVQRLEKMLADSTRGNDHTPCRYDSEEQEHIIGHLGDKIDNDMIDVRFELEDKLFDETQQLVLEKVEEQQSQLRKEMEEGWLDEIRQEIKKELKAELRRELAAEVKAELFKDMAQAMMRAACGDVGGKSGGIGSSQSTQSTDSTQ